MDVSLKGKRALVAGSTQGIGKAVAMELAHLGASVTLLARNETKLAQVVSELTAASGQIHHTICANFSDPQGLKNAIVRYLEQGNTVEILVNNTGGPAGGPIVDAEEDEFERAFTQHLICNHLLTKSVIPLMKEAGYGRIINVISTSVKAPLKGLGVSNTIRGAVANWAKTMANELAPFAITVNNVLPGATMTGRLESIIANKAEKTGKTEDVVKQQMLAEIPANRFAESAEIANAIAFLAGPAAGYITGINLPVDGGRLSCL